MPNVEVSASIDPIAPVEEGAHIAMPAVVGPRAHFYRGTGIAVTAKLAQDFLAHEGARLMYRPRSGAGSIAGRHAVVGACAEIERRASIENDAVVCTHTKIANGAIVKLSQQSATGYATKQSR